MKAEVTFKPSLRADAEDHGPLFFTVTGTTDIGLRLDGRRQLKEHLRSTKHPLASTSYWFMSSINEVDDE